MAEDPNYEPTPPDTDFMEGLKKKLDGNLSSAIMAGARASGGKYYPNVVCTMRSSSDSAFSSPRDPKAIVFPVRVGEESSSRGSFLNEEEDVPPTSRKYDASYKKTLTREMLKCGEDEYKESLRGLSRGHFQPIFNNLAEVYFLSLIHI